MTIRTILVDDEPLAIQGLELRLQTHEDVEIIDKCQNGREAIRAIKMHKPDLVFLDIQILQLFRLGSTACAPRGGGGETRLFSCSSPPIAIMRSARSRRTRWII